MFLSLKAANSNATQRFPLCCRWNTRPLRQKTSAANQDYQYLQRSKLKTMHFQKSLPRLPIPKLEKTCERYLAALEPIIQDSKQYQNTVNVVKEFEKGVGPQLQKELVAWDLQNKHTSYISEPWFDTYLKARVPLVLNYNPALSWKDDPVAKYNDQVVRASNFVISALRFKRSLEEDVLEPEVFHLNPKKSDNNRYRSIMRLTPQAIAFYASAAFQAYPLDMSQFHSLFSTTRIPCLGKDKLVKYNDSRHIAILRGGQFYICDVLDNDGNIKDPSFIYSCLKHVKSIKVDEKADSATIFTTEERDRWAKIREHLIQNPKNSENLSMVDKALFVLCLDDVTYGTDLIKQGHNFMHGDQGPGKPLNRWFDKSFSLIFTEDGMGSISFEHSWGDGVAVLRFFNETYFDTTKKHFVGPETAKNPQFDGARDVKHLSFEFDDFCKTAAEGAEVNFRKSTSKFRFNYYKSDALTRDTFKESKISPDSMFQLTFQVAFYKVFGFTPTTYEACSTSVFRKGRTEVVRSATMETKKTTAAFLAKDKYSVSDLRELLDKCSRKHGQLTKEAALGQGFDRHLFALRLMSEKRGDVAGIFKDKSYSDCNYFTLSTSTLYGECFSGGGFAPVVEDGYGIGYGYADGRVGLICTAYERDPNPFIEAAEETMRHIHEILKKAPAKKSG